MRNDKLKIIEARGLLLGSLDAAYKSFHAVMTFGGPSLYFHLQALEAARADNVARFIEMVYALLTSWGMHRMGQKGSKMRPFEEFEASLKPHWPSIRRLRHVTPDELDESNWSELRTLFLGIRCMQSGTSLVGNSKVMAHAIPNLIPPVDRQYTLRFIFKSTTIRNGAELEWETLRFILEEFFYPIARSESFRVKSEEWIKSQEDNKWDSSPLKIIDNLVIGHEKMGLKTKVE